MWGTGLLGNNGACSTLCQFSVTPFATHNQIGLFWCCFLSGWVCVYSRPLWVSPRNSPVRLGVSPAATSTRTGVFNQRFEALFPHAGTLGCPVWHPVHQLLQLCPSCFPICQLAGSASCHLAASPLCPAPHFCASYRLDECFFLISLVVGLPYSSIFCQFWLVFVFKFVVVLLWLCEEDSVSTYISILARSHKKYFIEGIFHIIFRHTKYYR